MHTSFSLHQFSNLEPEGFEIRDYSRLKFGSDQVAKCFGFALAEGFFEKYADVLMSNSCVVIPSPYNFIKNAATIMTEHFVSRLNELLVNANGNVVEMDTIKRKVSYTNDYGFLSKEKRKGLLDNDSFYLNRGFYQDKTLIFVDDVKITGTHEEKLKEVLIRDKVENDAIFVYFAEYLGDDAQIESAINLAAIQCTDDYLRVSREDNSHVIIRSIKYLLSQKDAANLTDAIGCISRKKLTEIYYGALAEGYYKIPSYQRNLEIIKVEVARKTLYECGS